MDLDIVPVPGQHLPTDAVVIHKPAYKDDWSDVSSNRKINFEPIYMFCHCFSHQISLAHRTPNVPRCRRNSHHQGRMARRALAIAIPTKTMNLMMIIWQWPNVQSNVQPHRLLVRMSFDTVSMPMFCPRHQKRIATQVLVVDVVSSRVMDRETPRTSHRWAHGHAADQLLPTCHWL